MAIDMVEDFHRENFKFDIIFMDINMPVIDGLKATKILKDKMKNNLIPNSMIIYVTAYDSAQD